MYSKYSIFRSDFVIELNLRMETISLKPPQATSNLAKTVIIKTITTQPRPMFNEPTEENSKFRLSL